MTSKTEEGNGKKIFGFDEAIDLTGTGCYNIGLLATLSVTLLAMCVDMFSFSVVIPLCTCEFNLTMLQKSILLSMPFIGPITTAYAWGYVSDTRGRRLSLIVGMSGSFVMSTLCAFSPNWITLAIFKLIGTCFCSSAQSGTFALLGESCPERVKGKYLLILSSIMHQGNAVYFTLSYLIGHLEFSYALGFVTFVPWRLLVIVLALPLGISAVALMFFYESPKFLLNLGREAQTLKVLKGIHARNSRKEQIYPVSLPPRYRLVSDLSEVLHQGEWDEFAVTPRKHLPPRYLHRVDVDKVVLKEEGNVDTRNLPLWTSLRDQTLPLFKPPMLFNTLLLYYLVVVIYSVCGGLYVWLPFLASGFTSAVNPDFSEGICSVVSQNNTIDDHTVAEECRAIDLQFLIVSLVSASTFSILNLLMSRLASRKRALLITFQSFGALCCLLTIVIPNQYSGLAYFGVISASLSMGPLFSYYVDLYPTSFRGMAACLGVMVARISSVLGINLIGPFITTECTYTFYALSAFTLSGALMSFLLPSDGLKKIEAVE